jgi:lipopolysaccharide assembly outer membrane protein LptD (OstA)
VEGYVEITLNGRDLYNIDFYKIRGTKVNYASQLEDVVAEDMVKLIDEVVG